MTRDEGEITFVYDGRAITQILLPDGRDLLGGTGGYYLIGSCSGTDDPNQNVTSVGSDGRTLHAPGGCPGAPFSLAYQRLDGRTLQVTVSLGPLPRDYETLSVPLDCDRALFERFLFDSASYWVGCGARWELRAGAAATGRFADIPRWCEIPGVGMVGLARANRKAGWLELQAPGVAHIRRILDAGTWVDASCAEHPGRATRKSCSCGTPRSTRRSGPGRC
jgi:hypothetical protein